MLVGITVKLPLADLSASIALTSLDVKSLSLSEGVDMTSLSSPLTFSHWGNVEEAALMLSSISPDHSSIFLVFALDMKSSIGEGVDEGILLVVLEDVENLVGGTLVVRDGESLVVVSESEGLLEVKNTDDLVGIVGVGCEDEILRSLHQKIS